MTTKEKNALVGMSNSYFESLRYSNPKVYQFYIKYGNGDIIKGFTKAREDYSDLKYKVFELACHYKETEGLKVKDLWLQVVEEFNSENSAIIICTKWINAIEAKHIHKIEKKLRVFKKLLELNKDIEYNW